MLCIGGGGVWKALSNDAIHDILCEKEHSSSSACESIIKAAATHWNNSGQEHNDISAAVVDFPAFLWDNAGRYQDIIKQLERLRSYVFGVSLDAN